MARFNHIAQLASLMEQNRITYQSHRTQLEAALPERHREAYGWCDYEGDVDSSFIASIMDISIPYASTILNELYTWGLICRDTEVSGGARRFIYRRRE